MGPSEDGKIKMNNGFWEELNLISERSTGRIYVSGDYKGKVGRGEVGRHGKDKQTYNGNRLIEYCALYKLIVTNTFY